MAILKNIKLKILSYKKTGTVTHAMEAVSAVKMRKSQERALGGRSYAAAALLDTLNACRARRTSRDTRSCAYALAKRRSSSSPVIKWLAGSLYSGNVIRKCPARILVSTESRQRADRHYLTRFGRRGGDYFAARVATRCATQQTTNVSDEITESEVQRVHTKDNFRRACAHRRDNLCLCRLSELFRPSNRR